MIIFNAAVFPESSGGFGDTVSFVIPTVREEVKVNHD
jgi:hypothetical protein